MPGTARSPGACAPGLRESDRFVKQSDKSDNPDVVGLRSLGSLDDVELHELVLVERTVSIGLNCGVVDEYICATVGLSDSG